MTTPKSRSAPPDCHHIAVRDEVHGWRASCCCGWRGRLFTMRKYAESERETHRIKAYTDCKREAATS